jgi:hypothetical protein
MRKGYWGDKRGIKEGIKMVKRMGKWQGIMGNNGEEWRNDREEWRGIKKNEEW